ncbi:hypothetical protein [Spirochaeta africana]|nr:hypothetical protein [Spirochaeta africana]
MNKVRTVIAIFTIVLLAVACASVSDLPESSDPLGLAGQTLLQAGRAVPVEQSGNSPQLPLHLRAELLETSLVVQGEEVRVGLSSRRLLPLVSYRFLEELNIEVFEYGLDVENARFTGILQQHQSGIESALAAVIPEIGFGGLLFRDVPVFVLDDREQEMFPEGFMMEIGNLFWLQQPVRMDLREGLLSTSGAVSDREYAQAGLDLTDFGLMVTGFETAALQRELIIDFASEDGIVVANADTGYFLEKYPQRVRGFQEIMQLPDGSHSDISPHYHVVPPQISWGNQELVNAGIELWSGDKVPDTMGIGFLLHFDVVFDPQNGVVGFHRYPAIPFEELMSYGFLANLYTAEIIRVYHDSEAEHSGMQVGSRIADPEAYYELMQSGAARGEFAVIQPDGTQDTVDYELEWIFPDAERSSLW